MAKPVIPRFSTFFITFAATTATVILCFTVIWIDFGGWDSIPSQQFSEAVPVRGLLGQLLSWIDSVSYFDSAVYTGKVVGSWPLANNVVRLVESILAMLFPWVMFPFAPYMSVKAGFVLLVLYSLGLFSLSVAATVLDGVSIFNTIDACNRRECQSISGTLDNLCDCDPNAWFFFLFGVDIWFCVVTFSLCLTWIIFLGQKVPDHVEEEDLYIFDYKNPKCTTPRGAASRTYLPNGGSKDIDGDNYQEDHEENVEEDYEQVQSPEQRDDQQPFSDQEHAYEENQSPTQYDDHQPYSDPEQVHSDIYVEEKY